MPPVPASMPESPDRTHLAAGLEIPRIVTGLWQIADMERGGENLALDAAADALEAYWQAGFDAFDMADHYGSSELIAGRLLARLGARPQVTSRALPHVFTKWVPEPGPMTRDIVLAGVRERLDRLQVERIDLLQFHWWQYDHPAYIDAMSVLNDLRNEGTIANLGVTNFDTAHLRLLLRHGIPVVSNQISFSLLDRRAAGAMSDFCLEAGCRILAYGTLAGGLFSERWLGREEPGPGEISDWSKSKYRRFVDASGGWQLFQELLHTLNSIAQRHGVSISNVATRWVLEHPAVAAVIIGARLGESEHRNENLAVFRFELGEEDHAEIAAVTARMSMLPGDCGDEYRRPPFLTASGDLSHHLETFPKIYCARPAPQRPSLLQVDSGSIWEEICGFSRAVKDGRRILVSGTTATHTDGTDICPDDAAGQTVYILDKIAASLAALGASMADVVRTRIYLSDVNDWEAVSRAHGAVFGEIRPANTLVAVAALVGGYKVEIEAEAIAPADADDA